MLPPSLSCHLLLWTWAVLVLVGCPLTNAARDCSSSSMPISKLAYDDELRQYVLVEKNVLLAEAGLLDDEDRSGRRSRRRLLGGGYLKDNRDWLVTERTPSSVRVLQSSDSQQRMADPNKNYTDFIFMRECPCSRPESRNAYTYCNVENWMCFVDRHPWENSWCENPTPQQIFVRNTLPILMVTYLIIAVACLTSPYIRRQLTGYCLSFCCRKRNERLVDTMVEDNPRLANYLLRRYMRRSRARGRDAAADANMPILLPVNFDMDVLRNWYRAQSPDSDGPKPTSLALKTMIYHEEDDNTVVVDKLDSDDNSNDEKVDDLKKKQKYTELSRQIQKTLNDDNEWNCTICFAAIEDGDRLGLLPCHHAFHVDCLKMWLKRRNACPLCQHAEVAEPQFEEEEDNGKVEPDTDDTDMDEEGEGEGENDTGDDMVDASVKSRPYEPTLVEMNP